MKRNSLENDNKEMKKNIQEMKKYSGDAFVDIRAEHLPSSRSPLGLPSSEPWPERYVFNFRLIYSSSRPQFNSSCNSVILNLFHLAGRHLNLGGLYFIF